MIGARSFDLPCRVEVSHRFESMHAHVEFDPPIPMFAGDQVRVHGHPIRAPFGQTVVEHRQATIIRAPWYVRLWTRWTGDLECTELLDVSFSDRRTL
jgi:hypothetical protein